MLNLFAAKLLVEKGLGCDCCVVIHRVEADVYAQDETQARELIKNSDPNATTVIKSLEHKGVVEQAQNPGVIVSSSLQIYKGSYSNSPLLKP